MTLQSRLFQMTALAALTLATACSTDGQDPPGSSGTGGAGGDPGPITRPEPAKPGKTDFTSEDQNGPGSGFGRAGGLPTAGAADSVSSPPTSPSPAPMEASAPAGRVADVEEGDIYKVVGNRLYYLNTYKGFIVYDVSDPKSPKRVSRLPVFGYPIEMFVEGNTVHALLRDALYLTQTNGKLEFARHNVSQLVTIDISDVANPKVLKTMDIRGQLREGVARKIENTIYVVSYLSRGYWWGWGYERNDPDRQDQAWVYSYDVSDRTNPRQAGELKVFEGGAVNFFDRTSGASFSRNFNGVWISATANALMVVENWWVSSSGGRVQNATGCGYYNSDQQAIVSLIDISDPKGSIQLHTKFETAGSLTDQFKQTYVHDPKTNRGTYYGIFARRGWNSTGCTGQQIVQNTIEAWDVTTRGAPARVGRLDFGKPDETVRGTAFDVDRQVAYAITARQIDPLYAISIADPRNLKVLSAIDGLSGDMSVFRLIGDKKFLLAVGRDNSATCTGFQDTVMNRPVSNNIAVSIIDVRDLAQIKLVQRQCVKVDSAGWVDSQVTRDLDQAHKMLGMHSDGTVNVITVPVSYWKRSETRDWSYDRNETAVGIMSWDVTKYDPAKPPAQQTVIQNHGTFVHPNGEVRRSVLFTHETQKQRMMANLSDTHVSLANIQDLNRPRLESVIEVAPYLSEIFRYGDHIVEQMQPRTGNSWYGDRSAVEFRVKVAGGDLEDKTPVATFLVGQVQRAVKHGNQLVVFRHVPGTPGTKQPNGTATGGSAAKSEAVVFDLVDPTKPRLAGRVDVPQDAFPYYRFYCGGFWSGFWFDSYYYGGGTQWADTAAGLVIARQSYDEATMKSGWKLAFLDLRDPNAPTLTEKELALGKDTHLTALTVDTIDGRGFYLGTRTMVGQVKRANGSTFYQWKDHAARWELDGDAWVKQSAVNVPGRIIRTYRSGDNQRMLLTSDSVSQWITDATSQQSHFVSWTRLSLLREIILDGKAAAELMDERTFENLSLASLVADGERLFVNGRRAYYGGGFAVGPRGAVTDSASTTPAVMQDMSDRLMAFDLSGKKLNLVYDQSTRMHNVTLMGVHQGRLFVNLAGDGILVVDVADAAKPSGLHFARTLGYATHIEFSGNDAYVGSGYFGTTHIDLRGTGSLALH